MGHEPSVRQSAPKEPAVSVYSTLFFAGSVPHGVLGTLFTVPSSKVAVLRDMEQFTGGAADLFNVQISVSGLPTIVWYLNSAPASSWHQWTGRTVIPAGGLIQAFAQNANDQLIVSGYLLDSP
jgi:hypothetical protein